MTDERREKRVREKKGSDRDELTEKRGWQDSHCPAKWPLRAKEEWINKYSSCSGGVYFLLLVCLRVLVSVHTCVCVSVFLCVWACMCVWQTSLSRPVCLQARCSGEITAPPPPLLPPGPAKSTNSTHCWWKACFCFESQLFGTRSTKTFTV